MKAHDEGYLIALKDVKDLLSMFASEPGKTNDGKTELRAAAYYISHLIIAKKDYLLDVKCDEMKQNP